MKREVYKTSSYTLTFLWGFKAKCVKRCQYANICLQNIVEITVSFSLLRTQNYKICVIKVHLVPDLNYSF
jgi:hypothetical protein